MLLACYDHFDDPIIPTRILLDQDLYVSESRHAPTQLFNLGYFTHYPAWLYVLYHNIAGKL